MKIAILGGSFNPVHIGHLFVADTVLSFGYDRIILVPAYQSPFKIGAEGASPGERLEMLCASIAGNPRFTVDDCEIRREGVSYTIDTIADIKERYRPLGKPGLILGNDLAETFHLWKNAPVIASEADIIIARRLPNSGNQGQFGALSSQKNEFPYPHIQLDNSLMDVSSRQVREKIRSGENWRYLVPDGARHIIEGRGLYGFAPPLEGEAREKVYETAVFMEHAARAALSPSRFLHSRNTALFAWDLCVRYGLDPLSGYVAGITHDICKSMDDEEITLLAREDGFSISKTEREKPSLLHGRAAAVLLKKRYTVRDEEVLEAVRWHVTGNVNAGPLAKIIYIADKIEVSRSGVGPELRKMSFTADLDDLLAAVLSNNVDYLTAQRLDVSEDTQALLSSLNAQKQGKKDENS